MTNKEKYIQAFVKGLEISEEQVNAELAYQGVDNWDSVGHMGLIAELEDAFDIMFETDDIIDFSSYDKGIEILKKYGVEIEK
jgi:acyl carrier protein